MTVIALKGVAGLGFLKKKRFSSATKMSSNRFAVLSEYPEGIPPVPEREKVHREKDHHEPGTGRRDRQKREGRGRSNWGNALDEANRPDLKEPEEGAEGAEQPESNEPKKNYTPAADFLASDSDDEDYAPKTVKKEVVIEERFKDLVAERKNPAVVIKEAPEEDDNTIDTGFLSTQEAIRRNATEHRGRGGQRGRGGPRMQSRDGPRDGPRGRGGPRRGRGGFEGRQGDAQPRREEAAEGERPHSRGGRGPRDARPHFGQQQRTSAGRRGGQLSMNNHNFPSLH